MTLLHAALALATVAEQPAEFRVEERNSLVEFSYGWPAAADAVPALRERLRREMEVERTEATGYAEEGRRFAAENGYDYNPQYYVKVWQLAGRTPQLLSLSASTETYTGGAHGNVSFSALLWDAAADAPVEAAAILGADALIRMTPRFCRALDAEREEIRGAPVHYDPEDSFTTCPELAEQVLVPEDEDGDGRFEALHVLIPPYVAGPYSDGPYTLPLSFQAADLAGLSAAFRPAFEAEADD